MVELKQNAPHERGKPICPRAWSVKMNVFPIEPKFEIGTKGFNDVDDNGIKLDLLNRGEFGQRLTNLVDSNTQPLVIALGSGPVKPLAFAAPD
jgi:hypothetical protein